MTRPTPAPWGCSIEHTAPAHLRRSERRTWLVVGLTALTMVVELVAGTLTGSLALIADGWHMGSHVAALGLSALAYWYARTRARARLFGFGTGKVYALAGYTSALALGLVALSMIVEAIRRLLAPRPIHYLEALPVAVVGLLVNLASAALLHHRHGSSAELAPDHNLRAAYLHVLTDALTSVLAIVALGGGAWLGWSFLDPTMGIVGGGVILHWAQALCRSAAGQLLDVVPSEDLVERVRGALERDGRTRVADLHLWSLGATGNGCVVTVVSADPAPVADYRRRVLERVALAHLTVEVHRDLDPRATP
jgi:cation diffusion facilitator family transporter